jgi:hypothetical protein
MDKRLKIGLLLMLAAVVLMPIAFLFKSANPTLTIATILLTMLLEFSGLIFVMITLLKRRKS